MVHVLLKPGVVRPEPYLAGVVKFLISQDLTETPFPGTVRLAVLQTQGEIQKLVLKWADEEDKRGENFELYFASV